MNTYSHHHYRTQAVETAGPAQLVLMLYDGALAALYRARLAEGSHETVNAELLKAQAIVTELRVTLDHERGGEIASSLAALYEFCLDRMISANVRKELRLLDEVESVLREIRDAWEQSCCDAVAAV